MSAQREYEGPLGQGLAIPFIRVIRDAYTVVANKGTMVTLHLWFLRAVKRLPGLIKIAISLTASAELDMRPPLSGEGTGVRAGIYGYTVAGKTGTGQRVVEETSLRTARLGFADLRDRVLTRCLHRICQL